MAIWDDVWCCGCSAVVDGDDCRPRSLLGYELTVLAAVVLGGTSLSAGAAR